MNNNTTKKLAEQARKSGGKKVVRTFERENASPLTVSKGVVTASAMLETAMSAQSAYTMGFKQSADANMAGVGKVSSFLEEDGFFYVPDLNLATPGDKFGYAAIGGQRVGINPHFVNTGGIAIATGPDSKAVTNEIKNPDENARRSLLDRAAHPSSATSDPLAALDAALRSETVALLGDLGRVIQSDEDLLGAMVQGFPSDVLTNLRKAGVPQAALEQVIAPRRTLMRRKSAGQRLTRPESDAAWRLGRAFTFASRVFNGPKVAAGWLMREKMSFASRTPIDLLETSIGAAHVDRLLRRLEWGDVA